MSDRTAYAIEDGDDGPAIVRTSEPALRLPVGRGLPEDEDGRAPYPDQVLFLDGVFTGPPFLDNGRRHYSLDHHAGCVRAFTLATCEQAAVLVKDGLPLAEGRWLLLINEPDLDAVLAAWLLLHFRELTDDDDRLLWDVMPLVRVEGVIDAHGLGRGATSGLSAEAWQAHEERLDRLIERERALRREGTWEDTDALEYTRELLERLDRLLLPAEHRSVGAEVEELERAVLRDGRVAILCRSERGIYAAEQRLRQRHGKRLGVVVLDAGGGRFTLLQTDPFQRHDLSELYPRLDAAEPGSPDPDDRWGGSNTIGGSPRRRGSGLDGRDVLSQVVDLYGRDGWLRRTLGWLRGG